MQAIPGSPAEKLRPCWRAAYAASNVSTSLQFGQRKISSAGCIPILGMTRTSFMACLQRWQLATESSSVLLMVHI